MVQENKYHQITAILLAAGGSTRLGQPKQLLQFKNRSLINHIIDQIMSAGLLSIRVVLGKHYSDVKAQISERNLEILQNTDWEKGISSSIKCGLSNLKPKTEAVLIFVVDQPFLRSELISEILNKFNDSKANIIAACVSGQIVHPVLYRKEVFAKLMKLEGDVGGKAIFGTELVDTVNWGDDKLLLDIDSIDDLKKINDLMD